MKNGIHSEQYFIWKILWKDKKDGMLQKSTVLKLNENRQRNISGKFEDIPRYGSGENIVSV